MKAIIYTRKATILALLLVALLIGNVASPHLLGNVFARPTRHNPNLAAAAASRSQIDLTWADNSVNEPGYKIERSTDGTAFTQIATVAANVTSDASTGLTSNTIYHYRVRAYNASGNSGYSNMVSTRTSSR